MTEREEIINVILNANENQIDTIVDCIIEVLNGEALKEI